MRKKFKSPHLWTTYVYAIRALKAPDRLTAKEAPEPINSMGTWRRKPEHYWHLRRKAERENGNRYPSFAQIPGPWRVARLAAKISDRRHGSRSGRRFIRAGVWFEWLSTRPKVWLTRSGTVRPVAELLSLAVIVGTLWTFWRDYEDRTEERKNRVWTLIAAAKENTGNIGLVDALHTLKNYEVTDLTRLTLLGAYLRKVELAGFKLDNANLQGADLEGARLDWADLSNADLSFANLAGSHSFETAELAGTDYVFAELTGTFLDINRPPPDVLPAP